MSRLMISDRQRSLFDAIRSSGELVFSCGHDGITANIVGEFFIEHHESEDRLAVGDGNQHVHILWDRLKRVEVGDFHGEGMLSFYDGDILLFRLYRMEGPYAPDVEAMMGDLTRLAG